MPENEMIEAQDVQTQGPGATTPAETKMQKFERERLSRRAALRKMGVTTGMAAFALFSVDDLARMVGRAMEQRKGDSQVAEVVAREFKQAGLAMAGTPPGPSAHGCGGFGTCNGLCPTGKCCTSTFNGCSCGPCVA